MVRMVASGGHNGCMSVGWQWPVRRSICDSLVTRDGDTARGDGNAGIAARPSGPSAIHGARTLLRISPWYRWRGAADVPRPGLSCIPLTGPAHLTQPATPRQGLRGRVPNRAAGFAVSLLV